jgi:Rps23 Pro-64 3,4-dihydroxylase Tpa1-like proline 4-hydroxylase
VSWLASPPSTWDLPALAARFRKARPFPHLILDDFIADHCRADLLDAFGEEPCTRFHDEIFDLLASAPNLEHPVLQSFRDELASADILTAFHHITGKRVSRIEMRGYGYESGHYLLPHADHQRGIGRALAYAYYLDTPFPAEGGELELFDCTFDAIGEIIATTPAGRITPTPNRFVLFDVGDASLHQVREVTAGARFSLSGWYYP